MECSTRAHRYPPNYREIRRGEPISASKRDAVSHSRRYVLRRMSRGRGANRVCSNGIPPSPSRILRALNNFRPAELLSREACRNHREQRARIIGEWLQTEARFLA